MYRHRSSVLRHSKHGWCASKRKRKLSLISALEIGQTASIRRSFSMKDVREFGAISGDTNPLHLDASYAQSTAFGKPVVHGMLSASLFSNLLGTQLPGPGTILLGQMLKFVKPIYVGETVTARVEITDVREDQGLIRLATQATTARGLCVDGEAVVRVSKNSYSGS